MRKWWWERTRQILRDWRVVWAFPWDKSRGTRHVSQLISSVDWRGVASQLHALDVHRQLSRVPLKMNIHVHTHTHIYTHDNVSSSYHFCTCMFAIYLGFKRLIWARTRTITMISSCNLFQSLRIASAFSKVCKIPFETSVLCKTLIVSCIF